MLYYPITGVSTHSRPKAAAYEVFNTYRCTIVSTHSRPKAAASNCSSTSSSVILFQHTAARRRLLKVTDQLKICNSRFNTQPPEGGCLLAKTNADIFAQFQHTAARRRLLSYNSNNVSCSSVSTHSRPKAAARRKSCRKSKSSCFNTQPPEGGCGFRITNITDVTPMFQHTAARRRLHGINGAYTNGALFQHTAARRRLRFANRLSISSAIVSTHSRPKAAALRATVLSILREVSTHSRPKAAAVVPYHS